MVPHTLACREQACLGYPGYGLSWVLSGLGLSTLQRMRGPLLGARAYVLAVAQVQWAAGVSVSPNAISCLHVSCAVVRSRT